MRKICHNTKSAIYDSGDKWIWKSENQEDVVVLKSDQPLFPLAAVIKWEMTEDDKDELNKLRLIALKEQKKPR